MSDTKSEPNLAEIYKNTYNTLVGQLPKESQDLVLAEVGKETEPPKPVASFIKAVAISAEAQYDKLVVLNEAEKVFKVPVQ